MPRGIFASRSRLNPPWSEIVPRRKPTAEDDDVLINVQRAAQPEDDQLTGCNRIYRIGHGSYSHAPKDGHARKEKRPRQTGHRRSLDP